MDPPRFKPSDTIQISKATKRTNSGRVKDDNSRPPTVVSRLSTMSAPTESSLQHPVVAIPAGAPIPQDARDHIEALLRRHDIHDVHRWIQIVWQQQNGLETSSTIPQLHSHASFQSNNSTETITQRRISTVSSAPSSLHPGSVGLQSRRVSQGSLFSVAPSMSSIGSDLTAYTDTSGSVQFAGYGQPQTYIPNGHISSLQTTFQPVEWSNQQMSSNPAVYTPSHQPSGRSPAVVNKKSLASLKESSESSSLKNVKIETEAPKSQKYVCTSCETKFIRKSDWKQHEERLHERRNQWRCPDCNLDQLWSRNQFKQHHKQAHGCENCPHSDQAIIPLKQRTAWGCGFCGDLQTEWEERCQHVAGHYDKGKVKADWKHSNVIWGLLHQSDVHPHWRELLHQKHGSRPSPRPQYSWDKKRTGRTHDVSQQGKPTSLQDLLEFGGEERDTTSIVQLAYELGIVNPTSADAEGRPNSSTPDLYVKNEADGRVLASPSPTSASAANNRMSVLTTSTTNTTHSAPELGRQPSWRVNLQPSNPVSMPEPSVVELPTTNVSPPPASNMDASPMSIVSPVQQLVGQLSAADVNTPTGTPSMQPQVTLPTHPSMFTTPSDLNGHMSQGPSWTPAEASHYHHQMQFMGMNAVLTPPSEKPLPQLPATHFDVPFMPQNMHRFSDDSALTNILFTDLNEAPSSVFVDSMPNLNFDFTLKVDGDETMGGADHMGV